MKTYEYKGIRYFYSKNQKMWVIETKEQYIYEKSKKAVIEAIDFFIENGIDI